MEGEGKVALITYSLDLPRRSALFPRLSRSLPPSLLALPSSPFASGEGRGEDGGEAHGDRQGRFPLFFLVLPRPFISTKVSANYFCAISHGRSVVRVLLAKSIKNSFELFIALLTLSPRRTTPSSGRASPSTSSTRSTRSSVPAQTLTTSSSPCEYLPVPHRTYVVLCVCMHVLYLHARAQPSYLHPTRNNPTPLPLLVVVLPPLLLPSQYSPGDVPSPPSSSFLGVRCGGCKAGKRRRRRGGGTFHPVFVFPSSHRRRTFAAVAPPPPFPRNMTSANCFPSRPTKKT